MSHVYVSQKFRNILVGATGVYHVIEAAQVVVDICYYWQYRDSWCAVTLCIPSLDMWFESNINERATSSNSENYSLWIWTGP